MRTSTMFMDVVGYTPRNMVLEYFLECRILDVAVSDIIEEYRLSKGTVYAMINEFVKQKLVVPSRIVGNTQLYKLNLENPVAHALAKLFDECLVKGEEIVVEQKVSIKQQKKK